MVLWILSLRYIFAYGTFTRYGGVFPYSLLLNFRSIIQSATPQNRSFTVWPIPLSLATTYGISFDFSSWGYLDVSVHPVYLRNAMNLHYVAWEFTSCGFPHSEIHGSIHMCWSPWLIAACRVLHRRLVPRHSPCALSNLTYFRCFRIGYGSSFVNNPKHKISEVFSPRLAVYHFSAFVVLNRLQDLLKNLKLLFVFVISLLM